MSKPPLFFQLQFERASRNISIYIAYICMRSYQRIQLTSLSLTFCDYMYVCLRVCFWLGYTSTCLCNEYERNRFSNIKKYIYREKYIRLLIYHRNSTISQIIQTKENSLNIKKSINIHL